MIGCEGDNATLDLDWLRIERPTDQEWITIATKIRPMPGLDVMDVNAITLRIADEDFVIEMAGSRHPQKDFDT